MEQQRIIAQDLVDFLYDSPTMFHGVANVKCMLDANGYEELYECQRWDITPGGKYYVMKNSSALIAFVAGKGDVEQYGFHIVGAHTDSPGFRVKPNPEMQVEGCYVRLNTEVYGGPILSTWMDRPLAIAGRVMLKSDDILRPKTVLVNINKPLMIIPNLAIHMNREVNKGVELNKQKDTLPLLAHINEQLEKGNYLLNSVADSLNVATADILDCDLFLYEYDKGGLIGINEEFISSSRLDDLSMVHAGIKALLVSEAADATNVVAAFDNEEVGSRTKQGGDSQFLSNTLERIVIASGGGRECFLRAVAKSFLISADLAHAVHPNVGEKHDPVIRPVLNGGPVIKLAASQSYTTDADSGAVYESICRAADVPYQKFVNRSDLVGGSTIGPISSTHLDMRAVDIGSPILAMHSIRELGGVKDHCYIIKTFEKFFEL